MSNFFTKRREPLTFMMGTAIVGMVIVFLGLMLLYVIRKNTADWLYFKLPGIFWISTLIIIFSSFTLNRANAALRQERFQLYKWLIGFTLTLGIAFIASQFIGWQQLVENGVVLNSSPSGAFLYVISGLHILHILGGLIFLAIIFVKALSQTTYVDAFVFSINPPTQLRMSLLTIYWHFVDLLWVFLFLFFLYHHS
jgi:cytochrome c oxidase subunit III